MPVESETVSLKIYDDFNPSFFYIPIMADQVLRMQACFQIFVILNCSEEDIAREFRWNKIIPNVEEDSDACGKGWKRMHMPFERFWRTIRSR